MSHKVLIVDDEPDVATYLSMILRTNGYVTAVADSVESSLEVLQDFHPDLICLDIMMPGKLGVSLYTHLKQDITLKRIPVIVVSGALQDDQSDFHSYLSDESIPVPDYIMEKPVNVEEFTAAVKQLITSRSSQKRRIGK
ncbi:MAG: response regulator [bacterium]